MYKKILLISPFYYGVGGVETSLRTLVKMLSRRGIDVKVVTSTIHPKLFELLEGKPILQFLHLCPTLFIKSLWALLTYRPNAVHAAGLAASVVARFLPKPYVSSTHAIYDGMYPSWVLDFAFKKAKRILCLTRDSVEEINLPQCKEYITLVDPDVFKPKTGIRDIPLLFVGRKLKKKGYDKAKSLGAVCLHNIPNDELPSYYNRAEVTITCAEYKECFSRVIIESMLCDTPVIISPNDMAYKVIPKEAMRKPREYALKHFGEENVKTFIDAYNF